MAGKIISSSWIDKTIVPITTYSQEEVDKKIIGILESVTKKQINTETKYSKLYRKNIWKKQRSKFKSGWAK